MLCTERDDSSEDPGDQQQLHGSEEQASFIDALVDQVVDRETLLMLRRSNRREQDEGLALIKCFPKNITRTETLKQARARQTSKQAGAR